MVRVAEARFTRSWAGWNRLEKLRWHVRRGGLGWLCWYLRLCRLAKCSVDSKLLLPSVERGCRRWRKNRLTSPSLRARRADASSVRALLFLARLEEPASIMRD